MMEEQKLSHAGLHANGAFELEDVRSLATGAVPLVKAEADPA